MIELKTRYAERRNATDAQSSARQIIPLKEKGAGQDTQR